LSVRNFTWQDVPPLFTFINLLRTTDGGGRTISLSSLKEELAQPGLSPEENCLIFEDGRDIQAYSVLHPELSIGRSVLDVGIHPNRSADDIERSVIRSGMERAKAIGARIIHVCAPQTGPLATALESEGLSQVREYRLMRCKELEIPLPEPPEGFGIESFKPGDAERLTSIQNASFDSNWGFCPNTTEEISYRAKMEICPPEGILFLTQGNQDAGYCWTFLLGDPNNPIGVIGMIGIHPAYRGRGLSKPILLAGLEYLRSMNVECVELDVDAQNSPAIKLYTSVGFTVVSKSYWFEGMPSA
jgi:mycothiol synthase